MKNVTIQENAFIFCRYTIAILIWIALFLKSVWILVVVLIILVLSALLKVQKAPMVFIYTNTLGRLIKSKDVILDERAMQFAHTMGTVLAIISLTILYFNGPIGWIFVAIFAVLKTISAFGLCPAYKLFGCMASGGCCALTKDDSRLP